MEYLLANEGSDDSSDIDVCLDERVLALDAHSASDAIHTEGYDSDYSSFPETILAAAEQWPLERWIHLRFCRVYHIHDWAHSQLVRLILFSSFCSRQTLPSSRDVTTALCAAKQLRLKLDDDSWTLIKSYVLAESIEAWYNIVGTADWAPAFREMNRDERGMMVIFSDAMIEPLDFTDMHLPAFFEVNSFLTNPTVHCSDQSDILEVASLEGRSLLTTSFDAFDIPSLEPDGCVCGKCSALQNHFKRNQDGFRRKYTAMSTSDGRGGCNALERVWEPLLTKAEHWVDGFMGRIECPFDLFPFITGRRLGVSVLEVLFTLNIDIGAHLANRQLLSFLTYLRCCHLCGDDGVEEPPAMIRNDFGFVISAEPDDDDKSFDIISSVGGWLYDVAGGGLTDDDATTPAKKIRIVRMPQLKPIKSINLPRDHATLEAPEVSSSPATIPHSSTNQVILDLSWDSIDGFPLLQDSADYQSPYISDEAYIFETRYGLQISTSYYDRLIRTWWKPKVIVGQPCSHNDAYGRMIRCSLTSNQVLLQVKPSTDPLLARRLGSKPISDHIDLAEAKQTAAIHFQHHKEVTTHLTERGGPLEHGRLCIVRCGNEEGPADPLVILGASLGMRAYTFHFQECWHCACARMRARGCTLGIVTGTKVITKCIHCMVAEERAERIIAELGVL